MQPGEGALNDPAGAAEPGAVLGLAARDLRPDPSLTQFAPVLVVVVAAVGGNSVGATARPTDLAAHGRHTLNQGDELGYVVAVAAGDRPGERDPRCLDEEMVLRAGSGPVNWARARLGAPFFACT